MKCPKCYGEEQYCEECFRKEASRMEIEYRGGRLKPRCDGSTDCGDSDCQECCPHDEHDHGICMDCGKDRTDDLVGAAEAYFEGDR